MTTLTFRLLLLTAACGATAANADESDQYLAWGHEFRDAAPILNAYINNDIGAVVASVNEGNPDCSCETLTTGILTSIYQDRFRANIIAYIDTENRIDVYPSRSLTSGEILDQSIYRYAVTALTIRVTRNLRIGDVVIGTDKLNHFFGIGRRYYTRYNGLLRDGRAQAEAEDDTIRWGVLTENTFLGTTTNGIISLADLEANYQGFRFAQDLCGGPNPYLVHSGEHWVQSRTVDLTTYISPFFDESFLPPLYSDIIRRSVNLAIERNYREGIDLQGVAARFDVYRRIAPTTSRSMQLVTAYLSERRSLTARRSSNRPRY